MFGSLNWLIWPMTYLGIPSLRNNLKALPSLEDTEQNPRWMTEWLLELCLESSRVCRYECQFYTGVGCCF